MLSIVAGQSHRVFDTPRNAASAEQNRHVLLHATYANPHAHKQFDFAKAPIEALTFGHAGQPPMPTLQAALHPLLDSGQAERPEEIKPGRAYRMRRHIRDARHSQALATLAAHLGDLPAARNVQLEPVELPKESYESLPSAIRECCNAVVDGDKVYVPAKEFIRHIKGQDGSAIQVDLPAGASNGAVKDLSSAILAHAKRGAPAGLYTHVKAQSTAQMKFASTQERSRRETTIEGRDAEGRPRENRTTIIPATPNYPGNDVARIHYYIDESDRTALGFLTQHDG